MQLDHRFATTVVWTGQRGTGTTGYRDYGRDHEVSASGKQSLLGSSDPHFRGDADRWNPEELLVAALSQCHLLAYLHVAADDGVIVTAYTDDAEGIMAQDRDGGGQFRSVTLRPHVTVADAAMADTADRLHERAHELCFIARSVNFPVHHEPTPVDVGPVAG